MKTTADFLDALRVKLDLPSDGRLADYLGMHRQHISRYRTLGHTFDDAMSLRIADLLEVDPAYVVACMHHQRAKVDAERALWQRIAERMAVAATICAVAVFAWAGIGTETAPLLAAITSPAVGSSGGLYIMSNGLLLLLAGLAAFYLLAFWGSTLRRHFVAFAVALGLAGCGSTPAEPVKPLHVVKVWQDDQGRIRMKSDEPPRPDPGEVLEEISTPAPLFHDPRVPPCPWRCKK